MKSNDLKKREIASPPRLPHGFPHVARTSFHSHHFVPGAGRPSAGFSHLQAVFHKKNNSHTMADKQTTAPARLVFACHMLRHESPNLGEEHERTAFCVARNRIMILRSQWKAKSPSGASESFSDKRGDWVSDNQETKKDDEVKEPLLFLPRLVGRFQSINQGRKRKKKKKGRKKKSMWMNNLLFGWLVLACLLGADGQRVGTRIVGGDAVSGDSPIRFFQVSLQTSSGFHYCGGSVISSRWILTAAHCGSSHSRVVLGALNIKASNANKIIRSTVRTIRHENYDPMTNNNDVALVELAQPLPSTFQGYPVTPIELGKAGFVGYNPGQEVTVSGWGTLASGGASPDLLQRVNVPITTREFCESSYDSSSMNWNVEICAGLAEGGKDSCQGDSGGPMFKFVGGRAIQVGVVSWGYGCAFPNAPGVYARVSAFEEWILSRVPGASFSSGVVTSAPTRSPLAGNLTHAPSPAPTTKSPSPSPTVAPTAWQPGIPAADDVVCSIMDFASQSAACLTVADFRYATFGPYDPVNSSWWGLDSDTSYVTTSGYGEERELCGFSDAKLGYLEDKLVQAQVPLVIRESRRCSILEQARIAERLGATMLVVYRSQRTEPLYIPRDEQGGKVGIPVLLTTYDSVDPLWISKNGRFYFGKRAEMYNTPAPTPNPTTSPTTASPTTSPTTPSPTASFHCRAQGFWQCKNRYKNFCKWVGRSAKKGRCVDKRATASPTVVPGPPTPPTLSPTPAPVQCATLKKFRACNSKRGVCVWRGSKKRGRCNTKTPVNQDDDDNEDNGRPCWWFNANIKNTNTRKQKCLAQQSPKCRFDGKWCRIV